MTSNDYTQFPVVFQENIGGTEIQTVNARDIHEFLQVGKDFSNWIKDRIEQYSFIENKDFIVFAKIGKKPQGGRPSKEYHVTLDMGKELSMVDRGERGKIVRKYFLECEKKAKEATVSIDLRDPKQLSKIAIQLIEVNQELTKKVEEAENKIEQSKPKVDFYDAFINADGLYGLQNAARALHCRPNLFIRWLKGTYLFYQGGSLVAKVQYTQSGIFEVKTTIVDDKARPQAFITPKGLKYLDALVPDDLRLRNAA